MGHFFGRVLHWASPRTSSTRSCFDVGKTAAYVEVMSLVLWAESKARECLERALPRRWAHVQGVAFVAGQLARDLGDDADTLVSAARLHDAGCAPHLAVVGFHSLGGAYFLQRRGFLSKRWTLSPSTPGRLPRPGNWTSMLSFVRSVMSGR